MLARNQISPVTSAQPVSAKAMTILYLHFTNHKQDLHVASVIMGRNIRTI